MAQFDTNYQSASAAGTKTGYDAGLRTHMLNVYNYMASGVLLTGIIAMMLGNALEGNVELQQTLYGSGLRWIIMLAPLAFVLVMSFGVNKISAPTLKLIFFAFSATMGVSLASIFLVYTGESIARTFFITAASFGALSLYGYTTKKDLSGMRTFLMMGLFGLIIASIVNIFLQSSMMQFVTSCIGVLIFAGFTAYDTQRIKHEYFQLAGTGMLAKAAIMSALKLYLDFVNLFMYLLHFLGNRD